MKKTLYLVRYGDYDGGKIGQTYNLFPTLDMDQVGPKIEEFKALNSIDQYPGALKRAEGNGPEAQRVRSWYTWKEELCDYWPSKGHRVWYNPHAMKFIDVLEFTLEV